MTEEYDMSKVHEKNRYYNIVLCILIITRSSSIRELPTIVHIGM